MKRALLQRPEPSGPGIPGAALPSSACGPKGRWATLPSSCSTGSATPRRPRILRAQARDARGAAALARLALGRALLSCWVSLVTRQPAFLRQPAGEGAASVPGADASPARSGPRALRPAPWGRLVLCTAGGSQGAGESASLVPPIPPAGAAPSRCQSLLEVYRCCVPVFATPASLAFIRLDVGVQVLVCVRNRF